MGEEEVKDHQEVVALRKTLDSTLDKMMRFLEMDFDPALPELTRHKVLTAVKSTAAWQSQYLSPDMLQAKIEELDAFMMDVVQHQRMLSARSHPDNPFRVRNSFQPASFAVMCFSFYYLHVASSTELLSKISQCRVSPMCPDV